MNRGDRREDIFVDDNNRLSFIETSRSLPVACHDVGIKCQSAHVEIGPRDLESISLDKLRIVVFDTWEVFEGIQLNAQFGQRLADF